MAVRHERLLYADERLAQPQPSRAGHGRYFRNTIRPLLHHDVDRADVADMLERIAIDDDQVRPAPRRDRPELGLLPQPRRAVRRAASRIAALGTPARSEARRGDQQAIRPLPTSQKDIAADRIPFQRGSSECFS